MREAPPSAVVGNAELGIGHGVDLLDLGLQPAPAFGEIRPLLRVAEIDLAHYRQQWNLEQDGVQPWPIDRDVDLAHLQW